MNYLNKSLDTSPLVSCYLGGLDHQPTLYKIIIWLSTFTPFVINFCFLLLPHSPKRNLEIGLKHKDIMNIIGGGTIKKYFPLNTTRRYSPLRGLTYSSCGGLRPSAEAFHAVSAYFRQFLVFTSNLSNFKYLPYLLFKKSKKSKKNQKNI